jgi:hypothetical protein
MITPTIYVIIALAALVVIAALLFFIYQKRGEKKFTPMVGLGFAFIIAGIFFGHSRFIGYGLIGIGVTLAVIDMNVKLNKA